MIPLSEARKRISQGRNLVGGSIEVTDDDVLRALESLEPLGGMFKVTVLGSSIFIRSVPKELNPDQATVLGVIQILGFVTVSMLRDNLIWEHARSVAVIEDLVADGLVWVDLQAEEVEYWSPASMHDES
jgi:ESCRT-II complex subunit VPS22